MKFMLISPEFPPGPGGLGTHAFELARHLVLNDWKGVVATAQTFSSEEAIDSFNKAQGFKVAALPRVAGLRGLKNRWRIVAEIIQSLGPDVLIGTGDRVNYFAAAVAARFRLPWVAIEHGRMPPYPERFLKRWCYQRASQVVCVSEYTRSQNMAKDITGPRLAVIPNGADPTRFKILSPGALSGLRERLPADTESVLLTVGSITERKGQDVVVRAMPSIVAVHPRVHYVCAGPPAKGEELLRLAAALGVERHVHVLGSVEAPMVVALMNLCDIFVMTSRHTASEWEGYGIAVVEAALCGKPAVVSMPSGLAEAIEEGRTGLGVRADDPEAVATAILLLLDNPVRRTEMGRAAQQRALAEQTWARRAAQYDSLLRNVVARHQNMRGSGSTSASEETHWQ